MSPLCIIPFELVCNQEFWFQYCPWWALFYWRFGVIFSCECFFIIWLGFWNMFVKCHLNNPYHLLLVSLPGCLVFFKRMKVALLFLILTRIPAFLGKKHSGTENSKNRRINGRVEKEKSGRVRLKASHQVPKHNIKLLQ